VLVASGGLVLKAKVHLASAWWRAGGDLKALLDGGATELGDYEK
jgi:hypothetical protein